MFQPSCPPSPSLWTRGRDWCLARVGSFFVIDTPPDSPQPRCSRLQCLAAGELLEARSSRLLEPSPRYVPGRGPGSCLVVSRASRSGVCEFVCLCVAISPSSLLPARPASTVHPQKPQTLAHTAPVSSPNLTVLHLITYLRRWYLLTSLSLSTLARQGCVDWGTLEEWEEDTSTQPLPAKTHKE